MRISYLSGPLFTLLALLPACGGQALTAEQERELELGSATAELELEPHFAAAKAALSERLGEDLKVEAVGERRSATVPLPCGVHLTGAPPDPFRFDDGTAQGWQIDGIYDGDTSRQEGILSGSAPWYDSTSYPSRIGGDPIDGDGALVAAGDELRDTLGQIALNRCWHVDFVSPELAPGWEGFREFEYRVLDSADVAPTLYTQLLLVVRKCDGSTTYLAEVDANGAFQFCPLQKGDQWTHCTADFNLPADVARVEHLVVRLFFPDQIRFEDAMYVDEVGVR